jgi:predicted esterase
LKTPVLLLLTLLATVPAAAQVVAQLTPDLPRGQVVERVTCAADKAQVYALYLPSGYTPKRTWPILYAFDQQENGKEAVETFREGAERYGWIVVGSYNTRSDEDMVRNFAAMRALWADTHERFALDDARVYTSGLSGTVRFALTLALTAPGTIAGVVGASAGFPVDRPPTRETQVDFFGTFGDKDFNYYEMVELEKKLSAIALPFRIESFDGGHVWPPPQLATHALGWLEMRAMKRGLREKDTAIVEALWTQDLQRAREAEAGGRIYDAFHTWSAMKADYAGLRDVAEAERKTAELGASTALKREIETREALLKRDMAYLAQAPRILGRAMAPGSETPPTAARVAKELDLADWKKRAASADRAESLSAERVLNTVFIQTGWYLPRMLTQRKDHEGAILMLTVAAEIRPDYSPVWVELAAAHARKGKSGRKRALEALDRAVGLGFADRALLDRETAFDGLRQDEQFRAILGKMGMEEGGRG